MKCSRGSLRLVELGATCHGNGLASIDTLVECKGSRGFIQQYYPAYEFMKEIQTTEYPKGCYVWINESSNQYQGYFNTNSSNASHIQTRALCKEVEELTVDDAKYQCRAFGPEWHVAKETSGSIVCTKNTIEWYYHCLSCDFWRLIVFKSGSDEYGTGSISTKAGMYYGGHSSCITIYPFNYDFPYCGSWPLDICRTLSYFFNLNF